MVLIQLPNEVDFETSPTPPAFDCSEYLRHDLLDALRWDVFGPLDDIQVKNASNDALELFSNHHIASEALWNPPSTTPPLTKVLVYIDACQQKAAHDSNDEEDRYQPPEPLLIKKDDGSPISIGNFVEGVHAYLGANKREIWMCEDEAYMGPPVSAEDGMKFVGIGPDDNGVGDHGEEHDCDEDCKCGYFWRSGNIPEGSRVVFDGVMMSEDEDGEYSMYVSLFVEGNFGEGLEEFWGRR
jgi:hypothetical protein